MKYRITIETLNPSKNDYSDYDTKTEYVQNIDGDASFIAEVITVVLKYITTTTVSPVIIKGEK